MWVERAFFEHLGIEFEEYQPVPIDRFREAVTTDHVYPLDAEYSVVTGPEPTTDLEEAMRTAVAETANYVLDPASASRSLGRSPRVPTGSRGSAPSPRNYPSSPPCRTPRGRSTSRTRPSSCVAPVAVRSGDCTPTS
jgi:hypothetical protein